MTVTRETIEAAISRWEKKARAELYLSENLHPKARAWLIEELERATKTEIIVEATPELMEALRAERNRPGAIEIVPVSDAQYDRIASEPAPRKGKKG